MSAPDRCPSRGPAELHPRALPADRDRDAVEYLICSRCGAQIGPVVVPDPDPAPASAVVIPISRSAAKPVHAIGPAKFLFAPLVSHLPAHAARASMSLDLMESDSRAEIFTADFANQLRGAAHV